MSHQYIPNDTDDIKKNLKKEINIDSLEDLFSDIPETILLRKKLALPTPLSELETRRVIEEILDKNLSTNEVVSFLGAGTWPHFVPALVDEISSRNEFLTSYTPYQPEVNQGILQALFEYQSMICEIVDMDVANCSMYDWASSLGEAARMAARVTRRNEILIPHFISPERLEVLKSYSKPAGIVVTEIKQSLEDGQFYLEDLKNKVSKNTAGVYVENPSYLGFLVNHVESISEIIHDAGGLLIVGVEPTSLGVFKPPGNYGADIVVGEGQPLGNYMNNGGPLLGIFACKDEPSLIRQMPGRIVGLTTTQDQNRRVFCMVLQTREQHIRRHKATSNICTNQTLCALRASSYMALLGWNGLKELSEIILSKTLYALKKLSELDSVRTPFFKACHFKDFTVNFDHASKSVEEVNHNLLEHKIYGGKPLNNEFPEMGQTSLYCVTELHTLEEINKLRESLEKILGD